MEQDFKSDLRANLKRCRPIIAVGLIVGCILCLFMNNIAVSALKVNPLMGSTFARMYYTASGMIPFIITGLGAAAFLFNIPAMRNAGEPKTTGDLKSRIAAIAIIPLVVSTVLLIVHCLLVLAKNGNLDGYVYLPVAYMGRYFLSLFFASLAILGYGLFSVPKRGIAMAAFIAIWCLLASMVSLMGQPMFVQMGAGDEWLENLRYVTITGLVDVTSLTSIGTDNADLTCLLKYAGILVIACILIATGYKLSAKKMGQ